MFEYNAEEISGAGEALRADRQRASRAAETIKALAHPLRLRIVALLCAGPTHVTALADALRVGQSIVSQQLRILRSRGLVGVERRDGHAFYRIAEPGLPALIHCIDGCR